jgi:diaminopimelate decarboxylase
MVVFPLTARANAAHHLEIGGCDATALARDFGTPLYIFDDEHLRSRARVVDRLVRTRWQNSLILYATKAYFSPYLARIFLDAGLGLDVTSEGELAIARRIDFPRGRIYLHGNNKTPAELRAAFSMGVEHVIVDNLAEIDLLAHIAEQANVTPRVLLRLAPAIDPHTHRYLATGIAESKFGLPLANGDARRAAQLMIQHPANLSFAGLHVHIGSQIFELEPFRNAIAAVLDFAQELKRDLGLELQELDMGGGWGVSYADDQPAISIESIVDAIVSILSERALSQPPRLLFEPGRALVAQSAVALYTVGAVKEIPGVVTYVSVDGGMGDNVRPALYGAKYTARVANRMDDAPTQHVAIAGRYCEQGDILIEDVALPRVEAGDLIAIPCAGAYQIPMSSNYNLIPRPAVISVRDGEPRVIRRRETIDDMLRCEIDE